MSLVVVVEARIEVMPVTQPEDEGEVGEEEEGEVEIHWHSHSRLILMDVI